MNEVVQAHLARTIRIAVYVAAFCGIVALGLAWWWALLIVVVVAVAL